MFSIDHSGYGYSKILCEDVTSWFLNRFFPRHKIDVTIIHRGLKREEVYGYCDVVEDSYRPREFLIELQTHMDTELYIKTLLHELTHLKQWVVVRCGFVTENCVILKNQWKNTSIGINHMRLRHGKKKKGYGELFYAPILANGSVNFNEFDVFYFEEEMTREEHDEMESIQGALIDMMQRAGLYFQQPMAV
jgi:hypothetical protein